MNLEFKLYRLKEDSAEYKILVKEYNSLNEFIVVGEDEDDPNFVKAIQTDEDGVKLISGLLINRIAYNIRKDSLELQGDSISHETVELDIPKEYLTLDIIEQIQRLNDCD